MLRMSMRSSSLSAARRALKKWRAVSLLLIAFARGLSRLEKTGGADAWAKTEELEITARAAAIHISWQLAELKDAPQPPNEEDAKAIEHLRFLGLAMLYLALVAQNIRRLLAGRGARRMPPLAFAAQALFAISTNSFHAPPFLDSG